MTLKPRAGGKQERTASVRLAMATDAAGLEASIPTMTSGIMHKRHVFKMLLFCNRQVLLIRRTSANAGCHVLSVTVQTSRCACFLLSTYSIGRLENVSRCYRLFVLPTLLYGVCMGSC